jgi:hypothetical protein
MTFWQCFPIMLLSINCIGLAWWISKVSDRVATLEQALRMRDWLDAINSGESPSDLAYMLQKGYLK